jgi:cell filamentation protein
VSWDPYLDLDHGVLRNLLGITDPEALARAESDYTAVRLAHLQHTDLPGGYDLDHLQEFHEVLFGDVYDWAGELRTVAIGKGAAFCPPERLRAEGGRIFARLAVEGYLRGLDRAAFVDGLTVLFAEVNALHPFREGNGRAQRAFFWQLALHAGWRVDFAALEVDKFHRACRESMTGGSDTLRELFDGVTGPA